MTEAKLTWSIWQALLKTFAWAFTYRGFHRFAEWITGLALNVEEHTITQSLVALGSPTTGRPWSPSPSTAPGTRTAPSGLTRPDRHSPRAASGTATASGPSMTPRSTAPARTSGAPAPSTSTPPAAPTAPAPSAPTTGSSSAPCCTTPTSPPGSCRSPAGSTSASRSCPPGPRDPGFQTKCQLAVAVAPRAGRHRQGQALGRFRRRLRRAQRGPAAGPARRRAAADRIPDPACGATPGCSLALPRSSAPERSRGRGPSGGSGCRRRGRAAAGPAVGRTAPPSSTAGGGRSAGRRWCACGGSLGRQVPVKAVVAKVEGYKKRFTLVSSAVELSGLQLVELFSAASGRKTGFAT